MSAAELWLQLFTHWGSRAVSEWITPPDKCFYTDILPLFLCMLFIHPLLWLRHFVCLCRSVNVSFCLSPSLFFSSVCISNFLYVVNSLSLSFCHTINCGDDGCPWLPEACESSTLNSQLCIVLCAIKTTPTQSRNSHTWSLSEHRSVWSK